MKASLLITRFTFLLLSLFLILLPELKQVRWNEDLKHFNAIKENENIIDIAAFGSSRASFAFHSKAISKEFLNVSGKNQCIVFDFSRFFCGMDHNYLMVKELLNSASVKKIIVEYSSNSNEKHPLFYLKASLPDLIMDFTASSTNLMSLSSYVSNYLKRFSMRLEYLLTSKIYSMRIKKKESLGAFGNFDHNKHRQKKNLDQLKEYEKRNKDVFFSSGQTWDIKSLEYKRLDHYTKKIIELAKAHNTELIFVHYIGRYESFLSQSFIKRFKDHYKIDLLQPNRETIEYWFSEELFNDVRHMNESGTKYFSKWLIEEIEND